MNKKIWNFWKNIMQKANEAYTEDPVNSGDETSEDSVSLLSEDGRASDANVFDSLNDLVSVKICSKCGLLAVDGLCNESAGGDASYDELFIEGTQPRESCSCHVKYSVCSETHMISNTYCKDAQTVVYLKTADAETTDYPYCVEANMVEEKCNVHTFSWYYKNLLKEREEARKKALEEQQKKEAEEKAKQEAEQNKDNYSSGGSSGTTTKPDNPGTAAKPGSSAPDGTSGSKGFLEWIKDLF